MLAWVEILSLGGACALPNIDALAQFTPEFHGGYRLDLKSGKQLSLSRSYRDKFLRKVRLSPLASVGSG